MLTWNFRRLLLLTNARMHAEHISRFRWNFQRDAVVFICVIGISVRLAVDELGKCGILLNIRTVQKYLLIITIHWQCEKDREQVHETARCGSSCRSFLNPYLKKAVFVLPNHIATHNSPCYGVVHNVLASADSQLWIGLFFFWRVDSSMDLKQHARFCIHFIVFSQANQKLWSTRLYTCLPIKSWHVVSLLPTFIASVTQPALIVTVLFLLFLSFFFHNAF